jgi:putative FmdB family regulatory protein
MPIYEYNCEECGHHFDVLIRNKSDYPKECPKCHTGKPVKAFSSFAVGASHAGAHSHEHCASCPSAAAGGCPSGGCPMMGE